MTADRPDATITSMTKHSAGKHGRTIGRKEQKALVAASHGVWCYVCQESHRWSNTCAQRAAELRAERQRAERPH
jgi:hypothetical protein